MPRRSRRRSEQLRGMGGIEARDGGRILCISWMFIDRVLSDLIILTMLDDNR
jgi:hypothetical protein